MVADTPFELFTTLALARPGSLAFDPNAPRWMSIARALFPIPALLVVGVLLWLFFRKTWRELDLESQQMRGEILAEGKWDRRPMVALILASLILTMHEYYGGRTFFDSAVREHLVAQFVKREKLALFFKYEDLWGFGWWASTRILGYIAPLLIWKFAFPKDSTLDFGLRTRGFFKHAWIYGLFLAVVLPAMLLVSREPDFGTYYPFYKQSSRSWFDFLVWESMYFAQFFALEVFFRGWWLGALRKSFGSGAIFAMAVPYCMIHYGKPYLEAMGAIIAGIALGSLSMRTKSIYQGFLVHITVAGLMDWLALSHRHALPTTMWPPTP
jgi:membrane protease YdiL (CAAX protease family)